MVDLVCGNWQPRPLIAFPIEGRANHPMAFDKIRQLADLWTGRPDSRLHGRSWQQVLQQATESNDLETLGRIDIVKTYGAKLGELIDILEEQSRSISHPGVRYIFSTAHKFKV